MEWNKCHLYVRYLNLLPRPIIAIDIDIDIGIGIGIGIPFTIIECIW